MANDLKRRNRAERSKLTVLGDGRAVQMHNVGLFDEGEREDIMRALVARLREIDSLPERTEEEVQAKSAAYDRLQGRDDWRALWTACDLWTWASFAPLTKETRHLVPTSGTVRQMIEKGTVPGNVIGAAQGAGAEIGCFHWRLAFPDVFGAASRGGFDAVLGNPPWEQVQPEEKKFFATRAPDIAEAAGARRKRMIAALSRDDPQLADEWTQFVQLIERSGKFMREGDRFPLTARGKLNLYSLFAEQFRTMLAPTGRAGVIVPTGIATDDSNKAFFAENVDRASLAALYDFENRRAIFEGVHRSYKFSLLVLAGAARQDARFRAGFFLLDPSEIHVPDKTFMLGADDIALFNPNTRTCPIFRSSRDADLTKAIYRVAPVLVDESKGDEGNPWGVSFQQGLFNMTSDSHLFRIREELEAESAQLGSDGRFRKAGIEWLPLYEAKLIHQYDHRFATYTGGSGDEKTRDLNLAEHQDPSCVTLPRYWVTKREVERAARSLSRFPHSYIVYRKIARNTDERTAIFAVLPTSGAGDSICVCDPGLTGPELLAFLANANSLVLDFCLRQKSGGANVGFFIVKQLPVLPPETYTKDLLDRIVPRVVELTYTAHDMAPFARDLGYHGPPYIWDEERRAQFRADLDAIFAHLYGVSRDDFAYILDTFPIVARKDIEKYGEYRTKRLCLESYDHFAPETLRKLELEVREVEVRFRRLVVDSLDGNIKDLPPTKREKLLESYERNRAGNRADREPTLRDLLEWATLEDLDPILRSEPVWRRIGHRFTSKRNLLDYLGWLRDFRNPMAHSRGLLENERIKGEEALSKLQSVLQDPR